MKHLLLMSQALGSDCNELRVFGEYSGRLDAEEVEKLPGYELFINFCTCKTLVEGLFHNSYNSPDDSGPDWSIDQDEVDDICYELEFLINTICKKVGIAVSEPKSDEHLKFDQDILARWYHFYEYHFNHILTQTEWYAFKWRRRNGGDVSEFLPKGNWRNHIC